MPKHSKGPWELRPLEFFQDGDGPPSGLEIVDANGEVVADNQTYYPHPLAPENASLIAAAPELLEALQTAVVVMLDLGACEEQNCSEPNCLRGLQKARKAIAKAEGK